MIKIIDKKNSILLNEVLPMKIQSYVVATNNQ